MNACMPSPVQLWEQLVQHLPPNARLRLNVSDSLMRRFSLAEALAAVDALHAAKPGVVLEFNTGHHYFGFRDTSPEVLRFFAEARYVSGLAFSLGLHGRATQVGQAGWLHGTAWRAQWHGMT